MALVQCCCGVSYFLRVNKYLFRVKRPDLVELGSLDCGNSLISEMLLSK